MPDGININLFAVAGYLMSKGHAVAVLAGDGADRTTLAYLYRPGSWPRVITVNRPGEPGYQGLTLSWLRSARRLVHKLGSDLVIHLDGPLPIDLGVPTVTMTYNLPAARESSTVRARYKRFAYARSGVAVAACSETRKSLAAQLDLTEDTIPVIPPCVLVDDTDEAGARDDVVAHLGTASYENVGATLRAFGRLPGETRLQVTGPVTADLVDHLRRLAPAVRRRVDLLGRIGFAQRRRLLRRAAVVSYPRRYGVPTVSASMLEALASGTPVVASPDVSHDALQHEVEGLRCPTDSPEDVAAALHTVLADADTRARLAEGAHTTSRRFTPEVVVPAYLALVPPS